MLVEYLFIEYRDLMRMIHRVGCVWFMMGRGFELGDLIANRVLVIPICAWVIAQLLKTIIYLVRERRLDLRYLVSAGGMPSAHSALVCALAAAVAMVYGMSSAIFAIAAIFAGVVMYDSAGVRQAVDIQSGILNRMLEELFKGHPLSEESLKELVGHTRLEVIAGAGLGILLAWVWV
jgi:hypothetical protein